MYKQLSHSKHFYRESRLVSPNIIDFDHELDQIKTVEDVRKTYQDYFSSVFSYDDERKFDEDLTLNFYDSFYNLDFSKVLKELELFVECITLLVENNKLNFLELPEPLKWLQVECRLAKQFSKSMITCCSSENKRWESFKSDVFSKSELDLSKFDLMKKNISFLKHEFTQNENFFSFNRSLDLYNELMNKKLLKKSDFITTSTIVIYNDDESGTKVSVSGENEIVRNLVKNVSPKLLTRPSEKFSDELIEILNNLILELSNFENMSQLRVHQIKELLNKSSSILNSEVKKIVFKDNFKAKFFEFGLHEFDCKPHKDFHELTDQDIENYFQFEDCLEPTEAVLKSGVIKVFQALFISKMWCAEKAIMHDLFKDEKYIDLGKVEAFVLGKFLEKDTNLKKTSIKVCSHCQLTDLLLKSKKVCIPAGQSYSSSPNTTPKHDKTRPYLDFRGVNKVLAY